ncbi:hypothetical protein M422DRAFT_52068 [Sphaerobolus stellatus SS14]|uniref:DUF6533 domain-containing protein n=1 Tax=Sphaerobolus stellatus (strain SS14) TaxID=990650 RepID=A0A0C9VA06_SPHS4|nr:hypothetical protein M422DRAFT_52068 [Sphaerobolus stellatus SS14]
MATLSDFDTFSLVAAHLLYERYATEALTIMLLLHYVLTFQQERLWVWRQRKNISTFLFIAFRYFPFITLALAQLNQYGLIIISENNSGITVQGCEFWWVRTAVGPLVSFTTGILRIQALRTTAASWVLGTTLPVYLGQLGVIIWSLWKDYTRPDPPAIHVSGSTINPCLSTKEIITGSISLAPIFIATIIFDITIFAFTFKKSLEIRRNSFSTPLINVITRDGNLYFMTYRARLTAPSAIFLVNIINMSIILAFPFSPNIGTINVQISGIITSALVSSLFLNLKEAAYRSRIFPSRSYEITSGSFPEPFIHRIPQEHPRTSRWNFPNLQAVWNLTSDIDDLGAELQSLAEPEYVDILEIGYNIGNRTQLSSEAYPMEDFETVPANMRGE